MDNNLRTEEIAKILAKQIDKKIFERKSAPVKEVLTLVATGAFLAASIVTPNLPVALKPFIKQKEEFEVWKRFNIRYLQRTLKRLEKQKLVEFGTSNGFQTIKITARGRTRVLQFAIDELTIDKPKVWDKQWRLVSYDIPTNLKNTRDSLREYLINWKFYPLHESVFLHAYPCFNQVEFLRQYLGIGEHLRMFIVTKIENDDVFREFFDI